MEKGPFVEDLQQPKKNIDAIPKKFRIQKLIESLNISLPFSFSVVSIDDYVCHYSLSQKSKKIGARCHEIFHGLKEPCSKSGCICPLEIMRKSKKKVKVERRCEDKSKEARILEISAYPLPIEKNELQLAAIFALDITAQKEIAQKLLENEAVMRRLNNELFETNRALAILAKNIEMQRKDAERHIADIISAKVLPLVVKLQTEKKLSSIADDLNLIRMILNDLVNTVSTGKMILTDLLSHTETKIIAMIKNGRSSEEIANRLFVSLETVKTHRKNIRKKLGLKNSKLGLASFVNGKLNEKADNSLIDVDVNPHFG